MLLTCINADSYSFFWGMIGTKICVLASVPFLLYKTKLASASVCSTSISNVLLKLMDLLRTEQRIINVGTESIILTVVDSAENEARTTRRSIRSAYLWEHPRPIPVPVYTISQLAC